MEFLSYICNGEGKESNFLQEVSLQFSERPATENQGKDHLGNQIDRTPWKNPTEYIKHIQDIKGLYEIRIIFGSDIIRIFCCFDTGKIIVLLSGFVKKTQKTPKREIEKALKLMKEYYEEKERH